MPKNCVHIDGEWPILGKRVKYRAHVTAVRGRDRSQEVIDDIHIEMDPATMNDRIAEYLSHDGVYDKVAKQIVNTEVLTKYAMLGLQSPKPPPE